MLRPTISTLLVAIASCAGQGDHKADPRELPKPEPTKPDPTSQPKPEPPTQAGGGSSTPESKVPVQLTWKIARNPSGKSLDVSYRVENKTDRKIYLLDQVVSSSAKGVAVDPERVVVRYDPTASVVVLVAGHVKPSDAVAKGAGVGVAVETMPVARELAAGASISGTKRVPLPLAPWHPDISAAAQMMDAIPGSATNVVLEISWLPDDAPAGQPAWEQRAAADGSKLRVPSSYFAPLKKQTRGDVQKLP